MMNIEMTFADILKDLMADNNLNQTQLADMLGLKQSQISEWLSGKNKPGYDSLRLICKTLGVSGDEILGLK